MATSARDNRIASVWLIADMSLNIVALTIVKAMGADYPALQLVFLRAAMGLALILPWAWRRRAAFATIDRLPVHALRIALSIVTLGTSFFAIARLPFALFTAINFTRPLLLMAMAAILLGERIGRPRWLAAGVGLVGAMIAIEPWRGPWTGAALLGVAALGVTVLSGTAAIIATRHLKGTPSVVMMVFYTAGLMLGSLPFVAVDWHPVAPEHWPLLLAIGIFAQSAQFCFLNAHWLGDAGVLGPVSYASLILSALAGYLVFAEVPSAGMILGATVIVAASFQASRSG